jgi:tetratricopeptide (TPR) repeat protein
MVSAIKTLEKQAQTDESVKKELLGKYTEFVNTHYETRPDIMPYCVKGADLAMEMKQYIPAANFQSILLREQYEKDDLKKRVLELADIMDKRKKNHASNVLRSAYLQRYPNADNIEDVRKKVPAEALDTRVYMDSLGAKIFLDPDQIGINEIAARNYVDACETFAMVLPDHKDTPALLFKAAELAKTVRTFPKTLSLYDWIIDKYPNYENAGLALFLKAFIMENQFKKFDEAKKLYAEFIEKYPDHKFADDAQFSLENIGKSGEEIMEIIEQRRKANEANGKEVETEPATE